MAEHRPAGGGARAVQSDGGSRPSSPEGTRPRDARPSQSVIYWRYLIFWLLFFGLVYFVTLYGIVAEA